MIALFIGRFQPLHKGHIWAIKEIVKDSDKIIIGIGSSTAKRSSTNPYSAKERREMIVQALKEEKITEYAIFDIPDARLDESWMETVNETIPKFDILYTGSSTMRELFTRHGNVVKWLPRHENISATEVRLRIAKAMEWQHLVPKKVKDIIEAIGTNRLKPREA
jgi:nicotinamide-nucleotide adenylyltransferase